MSEQITSYIEKITEAHFPENQLGGAVVVTWNGETVFRKGYGLANVELGVEIAPEMTFRIGSITKQFTGVAILMLQAEGKLKVDDEITEYLPDYPVRGRTITIRHLLHHTSGIKSYTAMPEWFPLIRKDLELPELIDLFKDEPLDFEPGEQFSYCNSGYVLLGAIIEKVGGVSYAEFIQERIFKPVGMTHSLYDDPHQIVPNRVSGYSLGPDRETVVNATYISMTHPHAAGALASSVDDLALWDAALMSGKLLPKAVLAEAFESGMLNDGTQTRYGYGWMSAEYAGQLFVTHNGGIPGFTSGSVSVPEAGLFVAILTNSDAVTFDPGELAFKIAAMVLGHPIEDPEPIHLPLEQLEAYGGVYESKTGISREITLEDGQLYYQRSDGNRSTIHPYAIDRFFWKDSVVRLAFERSAEKITLFKIIPLFGPEEVAIKKA